MNSNIKDFRVRVREDIDDELFNYLEQFSKNLRSRVLRNLAKKALEANLHESKHQQDSSSKKSSSSQFINGIELPEID